MNLKQMKKEELELMTYDDLAYLILKDTNQKMKINELFAKICEILDLSDSEYENKIADFFELLSTEKRFIMLEDGYWDLKEKHSQKIIIDEDDEEIEDIDDSPIIEEEKDDNYDSIDEEDDEEDLKEFAIIEEDDEENANLD